MLDTLHSWFDKRFLLPLPVAARRALWLTYGTAVHKAAWDFETTSGWKFGYGGQAALHYMVEALLTPDSTVMFYARRAPFEPRTPMRLTAESAGDFQDDHSSWQGWGTGRPLYTDIAVTRRDFAKRVAEMRSWQKNPNLA